MRASNVTVEPEDSSEEEGETAAVPVSGDYVALSVVGRVGDWRPEVVWWPGGRRGEGPLVSADLEAAVRAAGVPFAYSRSSGEGGSVTVFLWRANRPRSVEPAERAAGTDQPKV